jgi:hypothetical protein
MCRPSTTTQRPIKTSLCPALTTAIKSIEVEGKCPLQWGATPSTQSVRTASSSLSTSSGYELFSSFGSETSASSGSSAATASKPDSRSEKELTKIHHYLVTPTPPSEQRPSATASEKIDGSSSVSTQRLESFDGDSYIYVTPPPSPRLMPYRHSQVTPPPPLPLRPNRPRSVICLTIDDIPEALFFPIL